MNLGRIDKETIKEEWLIHPQMGDEMKYLELFAGVGMFGYAFKQAGWECAALCEIEEWPQKILAKHNPGVPIFSDVKELTYERLKAAGVARVDVIAGGFPCTDLSVAGKQKGIGRDTRSGLWHEFARVIGDVAAGQGFMPTVIVENVSALLTGDNGGWMRIVARDLAEIISDYGGGQIEGHVIPAGSADGLLSAGAPHRRDRVWIVADASRQQLEECINPGRENQWGTHAQPAGPGQGDERGQALADAGLPEPPGRNDTPSRDNSGSGARVQEGSEPTSRRRSGFESWGDIIGTDDVSDAIDNGLAATQEPGSSGAEIQHTTQRPDETGQPERVHPSAYVANDNSQPEQCGIDGCSGAGTRSATPGGEIHTGNQGSRADVPVANSVKRRPWEEPGQSAGHPSRESACNGGGDDANPCSPRSQGNEQPEPGRADGNESRGAAPEPCEAQTFGRRQLKPSLGSPVNGTANRLLGPGIAYHLINAPLCLACGNPDGHDGPCRLCWKDGTWEWNVPRVAPKSPQRTEKLKALGNGLVWMIPWAVAEALNQRNQEQQP